MTMAAPRSTMALWLPDSAATEVLAQVLAHTQPVFAVVYLHGDLGAGKSTLARAWLRALGVEGAIRSPTYTLVEPYLLTDSRWSAGGRAVHLDLYRIGDAGELEFLALDEGDTALWLVEWPERGRKGLPEPDLTINLAVSGEGRSVRLVTGSASGRAWMAELNDKDELQAFPESGSEEVAPDTGYIREK